MPGINEQAKQFRAALLRQERAASARMLAAYGAIWQRLKAQIDGLSAEIEAARSAGEDVSPSWLYRYNRLSLIQQNVEAEVRRFAAVAEPLIIATQRQAIEAAGQHTQALLESTLPGVSLVFSRLPREAVEQMVGMTAGGSPLKALLARLAPDAAGRVGQALVEAVALGHHPRQTARRVQDALGGNLARALTISRTETMRAYRSASHEIYRRNSDVLEGWVWTASLSARSCVMCIAMHGTTHPLSEELNSHPNCRCTPIPITKPFEGIPEARPQIERGETWFAAQPESYQREALGPAAFAAYQAGKVKLPDFVGVKSHPHWGRSFYKKNLGEALRGGGQLVPLPAMSQTSPQDVSGRSNRGKHAKGGFFATEETYPYQPQGRLLSQHDPNACVPACCRMLLFDELPDPENNVDLSEPHMRNLFATSKLGSSVNAVPGILSQFSLSRRYVHMAETTIEQLLDSLLLGPALVTVHSENYVGAHAVLIDEIADGLVAIRDPMPEGHGTAYRIPINIFLQAWSNKGGYTHAVIVVK